MSQHQVNGSGTDGERTVSENSNSRSSAVVDSTVWDDNNDDDDFSLEDHRVVVGFAAGTLASMFMGNNATTATTATPTATTTRATADNDGNDRSAVVTTVTQETMNDADSFDRTILSSTPSEEIPSSLTSSARTSISSVRLQGNSNTFYYYGSTAGDQLLLPGTVAVAADDDDDDDDDDENSSSSSMSLSTAVSEYRYVEWPVTTTTTSVPHTYSSELLSLQPSLVIDSSNSALSSVMTIPSSQSVSLMRRCHSHQSLSASSSSQQQQQQHIPPPHHSSAVFVHIGNQLMTRRDVQQQRPFPIIADDPIIMNNTHKHPSVWYEGYDDLDWERFRQVGKMIANAILEPETATTSTATTSTTTTTTSTDSTRSPVTLLLTDSSLETTTETTSPSESTHFEALATAQEVLPAALLCPLCHDVIVGATILDCGCAASAVCAPCWQAHVDRHARQEAKAAASAAAAWTADVVVESDFVWVPALPPPPLPPAMTAANLIPCCPTCHEQVHRVVVCHALEAAIQEFLRQLPATRNHLKRHYRNRYSRWREACLQKEILHRAQVEEQQRDRLLAQLIAREEEVLWNMKKSCSSGGKISFWQRCGMVLTSEPFLLVVAAAISFGFAMKARK